MGMPRGSRWKRLAVFSEDVNADDRVLALSHVLRAHQIETEWWKRTVPSMGSRGTAPQLCRDHHPKAEEWLMVRVGDWPLAYVLAKDLGISL